MCGYQGVRKDKNFFSENLVYFVSLLPPLCDLLFCIITDDLLKFCKIEANELKWSRNYNRKLLLCSPQKRRKYNQHFKLLFFKLNLPFGTSD